MENNSKAKRRIDYKWIVVGLCFLMVFVALGFCSSPKSLFIKAITGALEIDRTAYSVTDSIRYVTTAIVNIFFGFLIAKFGPKKLILAGFASLIISSLLYAFAEHLVLLYLAGMFLGMGLSWTTTTMVGYVVTRWCKENKGTIMGAILASNGVGGALAIQILRPIIQSSTFGYRRAYIVVACVLAGVALVMLAFFRDNPKREPKGDVAPAPKKKKRGVDWVGIETGLAVRKLYFWGILVCIFLSGFILQGVSGVTAAYYDDVGIGGETVGIILSMHSLLLACAKFATGFSYDRFGLRTTVSFCMLMAIGSSVCLVLIDSSPTGIALAAINSAISCFALPLETIVLPIYASDLFGAKSFNRILGIFVSVNTAGYALGSPVLNYCHKVTGSYRVGFAISIAVMLAVLILVQFVLSAANKTRKAVMAADSDADKKSSC